MRKLFFFLLLPGWLSAQSLSNTVLASGGDTFVAGGNALSFTVGEAVVQTLRTNAASLLQGFQQPYLVSLVTSTAPLAAVFRLYPNPAREFLRLELPAAAARAGLRLSLTNAAGREVFTERFFHPDPAGLTLALGDLPAGLYSLRAEGADGAVFQQKVFLMP